MRGLAFGVAVAVMLAGSPSFAQTPTQPAPAKPPAPTTQKPIVPLAPSNQTPPPAPARPPKPFPEGAKIGYVVLQRIANESAEGKAATSKIQALQQKKSAEVQDKQKQLQGLQQKLEKEGTVMSSTAQADVQKQVERLQVDIQRFTQDAQQEIQDLTTQLQGAFEQRMTPILGEVGQEKGLHYIFNAPDSGIVWADPGLDITTDVIKRLDASPAKPPVK